MDAVEAALTEYVAALVGCEAITSASVERAFRRVRRHRFLELWYRPNLTENRLAFLPVDYDRDHPSSANFAEIYSNQALVTAVQHSLPTSSTSQPALVARMLELLDLRPGMRVLEIGTGTGYNAALLAEILGAEGRVCTVEFQGDVAERARGYLTEEGYHDVQVVHGDGYLGVPEAGPFDRIVATVRCPDLSSHWLEQLSPDGFLLLPLHHGFSDPLVRIERDPTDVEGAIGRVVDNSGFMPIQGTLASANSWQSYMITGLPKEPTTSRPLPEGFALDQGTAESPFGSLEDWGFRFFLALSSRELWANNEGYGLADPGGSSALILTSDGMQGYSASGDTRSLDRLHDRLLHLHDEWNRLGRPTPPDYSLAFSPATRIEKPPEVPGREWFIVRPFFFEIVRLPEAVG